MESLSPEGLRVWGAFASLALTPVAALVLHRRKKAKLWQSELDVAFKVHERKDLALNKIL